VDLIGAHCEGHNAHSIGVCYIGGVDRDGKTPKDTRTLAQKAALISVLTELKQLYPGAKIYGHRDFDRKGKACPSFDAKTEYSKI
jgi:N-acetylmuramoyl-L-alanine amidase